MPTHMRVSKAPRLTFSSLHIGQRFRYQNLQQVLTKISYNTALPVHDPGAGAVTIALNCPVILFQTLSRRPRHSDHAP